MEWTDERTKQDNGIPFPMVQDIEVAAKVEGIHLDMVCGGLVVSSAQNLKRQLLVAIQYSA